MIQVTDTTLQSREVRWSLLSNSFMAILQSTVNKQKPVHEETEKTDNVMD